MLSGLWLATWACRVTSLRNRPSAFNGEREDRRSSTPVRMRRATSHGHGVSGDVSWPSIGMRVLLGTDTSGGGLCYPCATDPVGRPHLAGRTAGYREYTHRVPRTLIPHTLGKSTVSRPAAQFILGVGERTHPMPEAFARPFRPIALAASTLTSFPVHAMAQQLMAEEAFQQSGRNALTLIHTKNLTVVLTVSESGKCPPRASRPRSCHAAARCLARSSSHRQRDRPPLFLTSATRQCSRRTLRIVGGNNRTVRF